MYSIINNCQICGNTKLVKFLNLGKQPLCDNLTNKPYSSKSYKIEIIFCNKCLTAFQKYNIHKTKLFPKSYHYRSSNTADVVNGMKNFTKETKKMIKNLKNKKVLDIGCNDGSLLDEFKKKGAITFGIEPTDAYLEAKKKGHKIYNNFIDKNIAYKLKKKKFDIITFTNVFAHINNFKELINSLRILISKNTILVIENHYLGEVLKKNQFDTFYHEHPRTYSLNSFFHISKLLNMNIHKFSFVKRYNGNIRVFLTNKINYKIKSKLNLSLKKEKLLIKSISTPLSKVFPYIGPSLNINIFLNFKHNISLFLLCFP